MNQLAQDLRAAKALIDTPEKCVLDEVCSRNEAGTWRPAEASDVIRLHPVTAMERVAFIDADHDSDDWYEKGDQRRTNMLCTFRGVNKLEKPLFGFEGAISHWTKQEGRTHAEVMAAFDRAIERAEAQP